MKYANEEEEKHTRATKWNNLMILLSFWTKRPHRNKKKTEPRIDFLIHFK